MAVVDKEEVAGATYGREEDVRVSIIIYVYEIDPARSLAFFGVKDEPCGFCTVFKFKTTKVHVEASRV